MSLRSSGGSLVPHVLIAQCSCPSARGLQSSSAMKRRLDCAFLPCPHRRAKLARGLQAECKAGWSKAAQDGRAWLCGAWIAEQPRLHHSLKKWLSVFPAGDCSSSRCLAWHAACPYRNATEFVGGRERLTLLSSRCNRSTCFVCFCIGHCQPGLKLTSEIFAPDKSDLQ